MFNASWDTITSRPSRYSLVNSLNAASARAATYIFLASIVGTLRPGRGRGASAPEVKAATSIPDVSYTITDADTVVAELVDPITASARWTQFPARATTNPPATSCPPASPTECWSRTFAGPSPTPNATPSSSNSPKSSSAQAHSGNGSSSPKTLPAVRPRCCPPPDSTPPTPHGWSYSTLPSSACATECRALAHRRLFVPRYVCQRSFTTVLGCPISEAEPRGSRRAATGPPALLRA